MVTEVEPLTQDISMDGLSVDAAIFALHWTPSDPGIFESE